MTTPPNNKPACLVTGVAGFVGSHLAERLLRLGHAVVGVDNFASGFEHNMAEFMEHPGFIFRERDIREPGLLAMLADHFPDLKVCFHLAAVVSVPYSVSHPEETMETNLAATEQWLAAAEKVGFSAFVFAGSAAEYGDDDRLPLKEDYATEQTNHLSPYGRAKFLASRKVAASPIGVALRFFNIYGPRQDPSSPYSGVISKFSSLAHAGEPLTIFGDGQQTRDFIYVSDVVEAYLHAAGLAEGTPFASTASQVFNVGNGQPLSVQQLAETVNDLAVNSASIQYGPERPGDIRHSVASIDKLLKASAWQPVVPLRDGLEKTLAFEKGRKI